MLPRAYIVHRLRTRTRLRIPDRCQDTDYFDSLQEALGQLQGITGVEASSLSGSVLLQHPFMSLDDLVPELGALGHFELTNDKLPALHPMEAVVGKLSRTDRMIGEASSGALDLRTLAFVAALLLALRQAALGNLVGPAIPTLIGALSLLNLNGRFAPAETDAGQATAGDDG